MKKIKSLFTIVLALVLTASCDDAIDIIQDGELPMDLNTEADLQQYLRGQIYSNLDVSSDISLTAVFTDEVSIGIDNGGQDISLHRFFLNQSDGYVANMWLTNYTVINGVNRLLSEAESIPTTEAIPSILAEARALRAFSYLQLLSYFSTDMSNDNALGVILLDFVPQLETRFPRVSNGEIYALIESDLAFANENLKNPTGSDSYKYVTKNLVNSIYARMYLYRKNYPLAKEYAEKVKNESGLVLTKGILRTPTDTDNNPTTPDEIVETFPYTRMWADAERGEIIWAMSRPLEGSWGNIASAFYFNSTSASGSPYLEMGRILYNKLAAVSGDRRLVDFVDSSRKLDPDYETNINYIKADVIPINKYPGKTGQPLRNDLKIFRLSETYFILAECAIFQGDLATAAGYIRDVRAARNTLNPNPITLPNYTNATVALGDLLDERRKELCYEGFRYLDIKRLGALADRSVERHPTDDQIKSLPTTISNTDYRFTLPIPQAEVSGNPTIQQNPGYGN